MRNQKTCDFTVFDVNQLRKDHFNGLLFANVANWDERLFSSYFGQLQRNFLLPFNGIRWNPQFSHIFDGPSQRECADWVTKGETVGSDQSPRTKAAHHLLGVWV